MSVVEQDGKIWTYLSFPTAGSPAYPDHGIFLQARFDFANLLFAFMY
jgi:hypothetical protein